MTSHKDTVYCLTALPKSKLASGSKDNTIKIWRTTNSKLLSTLIGHSDYVKYDLGVVCKEFIKIMPFQFQEVNINHIKDDIIALETELKQHTPHIKDGTILQKSDLLHLNEYELYVFF